MSRTWSPNSQKVYDELDARLQVLVTRIRDEVVDISLVCGHRNQQDQDEANDTGHSQLRWPNGKHNKYPSVAVDLQPYPYPSSTPKLWASLGYIAGRAYAIAEEEGFQIRWGGDWDGDGDLTDQKFDDLFHLELTL